MSDLKISGVPHHEVDQVFPFIIDELDAVYKKTNLDLVCEPKDLLAGLRERSLQLWVGWIPSGQIVGFAITRLDHYPQGKTCTIIATGLANTERGEWDEYIQTVEEWAKNVEGCRLMFVNGRMGWKKVLEKSGYELDSITLSKVLDDEDHDIRNQSMESIH